MIAFAVGLVLGAVVATMWSKHRTQEAAMELLVQPVRFEIINNVHTLCLLRRGEVSEVIRQKEDELSSDIYQLSLLSNVLSHASTMRALNVAAKYRVDNPFSSDDAEIDKAVAQVLANISSQSKGTIAPLVISVNANGSVRSNATNSMRP